MKSLINIALTVILLLPSFGSFFVYTSFLLNQDEIIKNICVQRKLTTNTCKGHCELEKRIKKYNDNEKKSQNKVDEKTDLVFIQHAFFANCKFVNFENRIKKSNFFILEKKPIAVAFSCFRPPHFFI